MRDDDAKRKEFSEAISRIPPPVSCFSDGAACPWCGAMHETVTFGRNTCEECERPFWFGYPDWHEGKDPVSWVNFPWKAFYEMGERADLLEKWEPNDRLKSHYFRKTEERLDLYAEDNATQ